MNGVKLDFVFFVVKFYYKEHKGHKENDQFHPVYTVVASGNFGRRATDRIDERIVEFHRKSHVDSQSAFGVGEGKRGIETDISRKGANDDKNNF